MAPDIEALKAQIRDEFPKFTTVLKSDSPLMRAIAVVLGQHFMASFTTTIGNTVYLPSVWDSLSVAGQCAILRHERVHMRQARKLTFPLFAFLYLLVFFPVCLSWFRARFEMEAYAESMSAWREYGIDYKSSDRRASMLENFTGPSYGWMCPFSGYVGKWFDETVAGLDAGPTA